MRSHAALIPSPGAPNNPAAGLIEAGLKTMEVRSRNTCHRGPLVICTSRRATRAQDDPTVPRGVTSARWS